MPDTWGDIPPGIPFHLHCVVSMEGAHHPKHWTDASTARPDFVTWSAEEAVAWVRDQMIQHCGEASEQYDRKVIDETLALYDAPEVPGELPTLWNRLRASLARGRWATETYQLESRRKLVMQILGYADQPSDSKVAVCTQHRQPR